MTGISARAVVAVLLALAATYLPSPVARADTNGTVLLQTVPAMPRVPLVVDGVEVLTDSSGRATVQVANLNGIADTVSVAAAAYSDSQRIALGRIAILPHAVAHQSRLAVGLDVWSRTRLELTTGTVGVPVATVASVRLRSMTGIVKTVHPRRALTVELLARRPQLVHDELVAQPVTWSVAAVDAGPGVALTAAHGRFDPYASRTWPLRLSAVQGTVHLRTVPATSGVQFLVDGVSAVTDANGAATAQVSDLNDLESRLILSSSDLAGHDVSVLRVAKAPPRAVHERELVVALAVRRAVTLRFTDLNGAVVPASRVSGVTVQAEGGTSHFGPAQLRGPITLLAAKATLVHNVWRVRRPVYALASATIDGGQAVFAGQQRFVPSSGGEWTVKLSVFTVHLTAHDALLGTRVGSGLLITRPDGTRYAVSMPGSGAGALLPAMVRGDYRVRFAAALFGRTTSLRISRSDSFDVRIVTPLDVAIVCALVVLLAGAAVLVAMRVAHRTDSAP